MISDVTNQQKCNQIASAVCPNDYVCKSQVETRMKKYLTDQSFDQFFSNINSARCYYAWITEVKHSTERMNHFYGVTLKMIDVVLGTVETKNKLFVFNTTNNIVENYFKNIPANRSPLLAEFGLTFLGDTIINNDSYQLVLNYEYGGYNISFPELPGSGGSGSTGSGSTGSGSTGSGSTGSGKTSVATASNLVSSIFGSENTSNLLIPGLLIFAGYLIFKK